MWYRRDVCRRTDGVAFNGKTFDCSAFGGEVVRHWGWRTGHGKGFARGESHVRDGASAEVILGGIWWGGHLDGGVEGGRRSSLTIRVIVREQFGCGLYMYRKQ